MNQRDIDIAWAAGFLEGEGCFRWTAPLNQKGKAYGYAEIKASQNERDPLDKLVEIFGGKVRKEIKKEKSSQGYIYTWQVSADKCISIIGDIYKYMSIRRQNKMQEVMAFSLDRLAEKIRNRVTCRKGHKKIGKNLLLYSGRRICKQCAYSNAKKYYDNKRIKEISILEKDLEIKYGL